jgi:hypothetical protein
LNERPKVDGKLAAANVARSPDPAQFEYAGSLAQFLIELSNSIS